MEDDRRENALDVFRRQTDDIGSYVAEQGRQDRADAESESRASLRDTIRSGLEAAKEAAAEREDWGAARSDREALERDSQIPAAEAARFFTRLDEAGTRYGPQAARAALVDFYGRQAPRTPGVPKPRDYGSRLLNDESALQAYTRDKDGVRASIFKTMRAVADGRREEALRREVGGAKPGHLTHADFWRRLRSYDAALAGDPRNIDRVADAFARPHATHQLNTNLDDLYRAQPALAQHEDAIAAELERMTEQGQRTSDMWADFFRASGAVAGRAHAARAAKAPLPPGGPGLPPALEKELRGRPSARDSVRAAVAAIGGRRPA